MTDYKPLPNFETTYRAKTGKDIRPEEVQRPKQYVCLTGSERKNKPGQGRKAKVIPNPLYDALQARKEQINAMGVDVEITDATMVQFERDLDDMLTGVVQTVKVDYPNDRALLSKAALLVLCTELKEFSAKNIQECMGYSSKQAYRYLKGLKIIAAVR